MAGMAEQQTEWRNQMADRMVEWPEWREWLNGRKNGRMAKLAEMDTYVLIMVHADTDDDTDNDDTLIFYIKEWLTWV